jgi:hypothetical protein
MHHTGAARAVKESVLADDLNLGGRSTRHLQQLIEHLIVVQKKPIASSCRKPMGVFVAQTSEEKAAYANQLRGRIIGLARRMRAFSDAPLDETFKQAGLFEEPLGKER